MKWNNMIDIIAEHITLWNTLKITTQNQKNTSQTL